MLVIWPTPASNKEKWLTTHFISYPLFWWSIESSINTTLAFFCLRYTLFTCRVKKQQQQQILTNKALHKRCSEEIQDRLWCVMYLAKQTCARACKMCRWFIFLRSSQSFYINSRNLKTRDGCTYQCRPEWITSEFMPHKHSFCYGRGLWETKTIHVNQSMCTHTMQHIFKRLL